MTETAALKREVFFDIGERLDKLLLDVAIVLPPPKITQQQSASVDVVTADCPKNIARNMNGPCGARCPQLPKVL